MERRVIRREQDRFRTADGATLYWRRWLPRDPRRLMLLVHGCAEHSGRYDAVAAWFATHDTAVHAYDLRGHGRSDGSLERRNAWSALSHDLAAVGEHLRKYNGDLPIVAFGHQLGGVLVLRGLAERTLQADAAVTSGALLEHGAGSFPPQGTTVRWLARLAPWRRVATGIDPSALSRDPEVVRAYREDPLVQTRLPAGFAHALASLERGGVQFVGSIRVPVLLLHGEADTVCAAAGSRHGHASLRGGGHALHVYPQLRHEVFHEPEAGTVLEDALRWIEERGL